MATRSLRGKRITLSCTLNNQQGTLLGNPGSVLTVGRDVSVTLAKQLLASQSAVLIGARLVPTPSNPLEWPDPVRWGPFEGKGKIDAKTISVHIPINLDGGEGATSWLKLHAAPLTFCKLSDDWDQTISDNRLGQLMIKIILAGSGNDSAFSKCIFPSGIKVEKLVPGKVQRERAVPITIHLHHDGAEHALKLLTEKVVFQKLASFHHGDEASDIRFGYILREALWEGRRHLSCTQPINGKKRGKSPQRVAWKTAAWLGPALLAQLKSHYQGRSKVIEAIRTCMTKEQPSVKHTVRNMAAFLVNKNWMNYVQLRLQHARNHIESRKIRAWGFAFAPLRKLAGQDGTFGSVEFWDEIYHKQCHLKRFPWGLLRKRNKARFKELMEQPCKDHHLQQNAGCDWEKLKNENRTQFNRLLNEFMRNKRLVDRHTAHFQFTCDRRISKALARRMMWSPAQRRELRKEAHSGDILLAIPIPGPTFLLSKSFEETVDDILLGRDIFILSH